jgi:DNA-directed RNA polymerase subunit RPC12/RpoP
LGFECDQYGKLADHLLANGVIVQAHGYWKIKGVLIRTTGAKNYTCSVCGKENFHTPFCSECGAKMDAEREGKG